MNMMVIGDNFQVLSAFEKNPDRKVGDECEFFSLRRDFAPEEARGGDTPSVSSREFHYYID